MRAYVKSWKLYIRRTWGILPAFDCRHMHVPAMKVIRYWHASNTKWTSAIVAENKKRINVKETKVLKL
jgi:hypothetical protein